VVCCIVNNSKLFRFVPNKLNHQFIEFDKAYKKVTSFEWDTEKSIIVAFESGFISVISMDLNALGKELHSFRPSMSPIEQIQINQEVRKIAIASQGNIKFYSCDTWVEESQDRIDIQKSAGTITKMHWTRDGSIISVTTSSGYFLGFLTVVP
jgi:hypothetical protein